MTEYSCKVRRYLAWRYGDEEKACQSAQASGDTGGRTKGKESRTERGGNNSMGNLFLGAAGDKEGFGYTRLRRVWDEVNYLADSVSKGYVSIADLEKELEDYGITLR